MGSWKHLRAELFRNIEPTVQLIAVSRPLDGLLTPESLPGLSAAISRESTHDDHLRRNRDLLSRVHMTPFEALQFNFFITGISKSCGAQLSRYRVGQGHVSRSTRYVKASGNDFVYNAYHYIEDEALVRELYAGDEARCKQALEAYEDRIRAGVKKEDARKMMPLCFASSRHWWVNARALRHLFNERLVASAEWEIRRVVCMVFDLAMEVAPSVFSDQLPMREKAWNTMLISRDGEILEAREE